MSRKVTLVKYIVSLLAGFIISVAIGAVNTVEVKAAPDIVMVNATDVNVRSQATTTSKSYGKVSKGTMLNRNEERADGWSCIDYAGKKAYIKSEFLTPYTMGFASVSLPTATETTGLDFALPTATTSAVAASSVPVAATAPAVTKSQPVSSGGTVWIPRTGSKYHRNPNCSNMRSPSSMSESDAINAGYEPCKKCY
ncbi:MAG: hypothetical protein IKO16_00470 [Lachnospiraceae bacterium]|nr:hypothetical protein [Lachnospiraceae bacterium]